MERTEINNEVLCPSPDIAAYVDGELTPDQELQLDLHMAGCRVCSDELNLQKNLLNALEGSLDERAFELPKDFAKTVIVNAESRVSGLRHPTERRRAAVVFSALLLVAILVLGGNVGVVFAAAATIAEKAIAVIVSVGHFVYDIALGSVIIVRSVASDLVFDSANGVALLLLVLVVSLLLSSRLLVRFHRT
jgi:anti-sigma factor RsiW